MAAKRKLAAMSPAPEDPVDPSEELMFLCLGGGNEVGRSCHILQYKGKTVMLDAGMHPAHKGIAALPFYDDFDLSTVDVCLISHFHLDHAQSLPYVMAKTNFQGRVFMTHPTKAIYKWLIQDSIRVSNTYDADQQPLLYTEADHFSTFPQIEAIDYHTTHTISSIRITPYPAGHVLGGAMYLIEIAGLKILFTGDYSREDDRHLIPAEVPKGIKIDVLITESTYGIATHAPRLEREAALMKSITRILFRGGRVLMPVFALGMAQELLLILEEYWTRHADVQKIPIYYASNLARKCMVVYQTYIGAMNDNIKRLFREQMAEAESTGNVGKGGPWDFKYIRSLKSVERFEDVGGCVMLANPGMLQNGISRELLERWASDARNGVILTGYSVEGTMARELMKEPEAIPAIRSRNAGKGRGPAGGEDDKKVMIPRRCTVEEFSFAAHVDGRENREFIEEIAAPVVILVHGEQHGMMRLKSKLLSLNAEKSEKTKVFSPRNCEELKIPFKADKIAKVVGRLAQIPPPNPTSNLDDNAQLVTGVLVQNDFKLSFMVPEDLREYAGLTTTTIMCKQRLSLNAGIELIQWVLESTFGSVEIHHRDPRMNGESKINGAANSHPNGDADEEVDRSSTTMVVMGCVTVRYQTNGEVELEWEGNMMNDGIADAVMGALFMVQTSPAAVKHSSSMHSHNHHSPLTIPEHNPHANIDPNSRLDGVLMFLEAQFGKDISIIERPKLPQRPTATITESAADSTAIKSEQSDSEADDLTELEEQELMRLHKLGIPVPGLEIRVDKHVAKVWLETLEVECSYALLRDRVRVVVERAVETVAPLWREQQGVGGKTILG